MRKLAALVIPLGFAGALFAQAPTFSPAPGTYAGTQNVTLTCPTGKTAFYRTDGQLVTIASTKYSAAIPVSSTQTISAICATLGAYQANTQASTAGSTCQTALGGTWGSLTCTSGGGVGTVNPSNVTWSIPGGSSEEVATITAPASSGSSVQALFKRQYGGAVDPSAPTCDTCTEHVKDIKFTVIGSGMDNQEFDSVQFDHTDGIDRQNGTQCQGSSGLIEVDSGNAGGHWTQTTAHCSNWTSGTTHEVVNRVDHDLTGLCPGGNGCALYKYIWIDGTNYPLLGNYSNTQGYNSSTGSAWGWQFQPDMKTTGASAATGGWAIISSTVALGFGDESATTTGVYTIGGAAPSFAVIAGNGVKVGAGVSLGGVTVAPPPPTSGLTFSPTAGSYTGTQNITVAYTPSASGRNIFCTTDGTPASEASHLYGGPIPVASSATLNCLVENTGSVRQETQALPNVGNDTSKGWKFCTPAFSNSNGTPTSGNSSQCGGGVGSDQPSTWSIVNGTTETLSISSTGGSPQFLNTLGGSGCDTCTKITQDKWVKPVQGQNMQNYEMDMWHVDSVHNLLDMVGIQCNQQKGKLQWQIDNQGNGWVNTGITQGCPLSATLWTHVIAHAHWTNGDTGCGGNGCIHYDDIWLGTATSPGVPTTMTQNLINMTLPRTTSTWGPGCSQQDQEDLPSGGTPSSPLTAGEMIQHNAVTCSFGTLATGSAAYTIH